MAIPNLLSFHLGNKSHYNNLAISFSILYKYTNTYIYVSTYISIKISYCYF